MLRAALVAMLLSTPAAADIVVVFAESAPKDIFTVRNQSDCPTGPLSVTIDLSGSAAGLIFDTTGSGAGVSVFQPLEIAFGADNVAAISDLGDGDTKVVVNLAELPGKGQVVFTTDVDDTLAQSGNGQTMISGNEIFGARLIIEAGGADPRTATFDSGGRASVGWESCLS